MTTRTLGFVSQPFYPPGIGGAANPNLAFDPNANDPSLFVSPGNLAPGPLYNLAVQNQLPTQVDRWGNPLPDPGYQNDLIAFEGGRGFEPPPELRIDNFEFDGVKLPYLMFPETPR